MDEAIRNVVKAVFTECGILSVVLFLGLVFQTWRLILSERALAVQRESFLRSADARSQAFISLNQALIEMQSGLRLLLDRASR